MARRTLGDSLISLCFLIHIFAFFRLTPNGTLPPKHFGLTMYRLTWYAKKINSDTHTAPTSKLDSTADIGRLKLTSGFTLLDTLHRPQRGLERARIQ
jgi:hypothetical protein